MVFTYLVLIMASFTGMVFLNITGIFLAVFATIYAYCFWIFQTWKRKNVPHFEPRFPQGNLISTALYDDVLKIINKAKKKGWKYCGIYIGARPYFVPLDLEIFRNVLTKDFNHFVDRGNYYNEKDDPISANLFFLGGDRWKILRAKLTPTFTSGKLKQMFQLMLDNKSKLEKNLEELDKREPLDIKHTLACFTIDNILSFAFGLDCDSFKEAGTPFLKYGEKWLRPNLITRLLDIFANSFPNLSRYLHVKLMPGDVCQFFNEAVNKTVSYREENNYTRNDFLQLLINIKNGRTNDTTTTEGHLDTLTMDEIVAQCFIFFIGGYETTSTTLTFTLFELSQHPDIQEKARQEILEVLKKYDDKISYDALKELHYLQQIMDETLRKYPTIPYITRQCVMDYQIPNTDVTLEKGTNVLIPIRQIHYDEDYYENPEIFDPERFAPEKRNKIPKYAHIPFGEGPRICIGLRFGIVQMKMALVTILSKYSVKFNSKTKFPLEIDPASFVPSIIGKLWLDLEKLEGN